MLFFKIIFKEIYHLFRKKHGRKFLWLAWRYGRKPRYQAVQINVSKFLLEVPDALSFIWQYKEIFVDESYGFLSETEQPYILDCGANLGLSCLYFKQIYPEAKIIAFEADPKIAKVLRKNLENNHAEDIEVIAQAVWSHPEGVAMHLAGADVSSVHGKGEKVAVPSIRLKDYLVEASQVDMLKIDIEGAELEVVQDCRGELQKVKNLFVEYHSFSGEKQNLHKLLAILTENQFRYYIVHPFPKEAPLLNRLERQGQTMDLQLNIHAYREE